MLESLFNEVADLKACDFIKKRLQYRCYPVKFAKFLRTPYLEDNLQTTASVKFSSEVSSMEWLLRFF